MNTNSVHGTSPDPAEDTAAAVADAGDALLMLARSHPELALALARLAGVVAREAGRTGRFASKLTDALISVRYDEAAWPAERRRSGRRAPGVIDPFEVYRASGEGGLRAKLGTLEIEQLRDIIAEHGMDHDRLAMRWKDPSRVAERIIERVAARTEKGSAFRTPRQ